MNQVEFDGKRIPDAATPKLDFGSN